MSDLAEQWREALLEFAADAVRVGREMEHGDEISQAILMMAGTMGKQKLIEATRALMEAAWRSGYAHNYGGAPLVTLAHITAKVRDYLPDEDDNGKSS